MWAAWVRDWSEPVPRWRGLCVRQTWIGAQDKARTWAKKNGASDDPDVLGTQIDIVILWQGWGEPYGPLTYTNWDVEQLLLNGAPDPF